ncbi:MAG TPA: cell division protein ZapA [Desulfosalsimonadaceae bacterium]|nr:cell division protein ZapA [Desulfosalsimonadaceae bacterium]
MEQLITIELLGETFQFKVDEVHLNPKEIADHLTAEIESVSGQFPKHVVKTNKMAILVSAALNITKQYFELKTNHSDLIANVADRTLKLDDLLDKIDP